MTDSTRERYRMVIRNFKEFVGADTPLEQITKSHFERYKAHRYKLIMAKKQSRGGGSIPLDIAVLHRLLNFAVQQELLVKKPISMKTETKPGENPKNPARAFSDEEMKRLRDHVGKDEYVFLLLRWTGLRAQMRLLCAGKTFILTWDQWRD